MSNKKIGFDLGRQHPTKVFRLSFDIPFYPRSKSKAEYEVELWSPILGQEVISVEMDELKIRIIRETVDSQGYHDFGCVSVDGFLKRKEGGVPFLVMEANLILPPKEEDEVFKNILSWCSPVYTDPTSITYSCSMRYKAFP